MTYYSEIKNIKQNIISGIMGITWISNSVYKNTWRTDSTFPNVTVYTTDDDTELTGLSDREYIIRPGFAVVFRNLGSGTPETDKGVLESGVGALFDHFRNAASMYSGNIVYERLMVEGIEYAEPSPGINQKVLLEGKLDVRVEKHVA